MGLFISFDPNSSINLLMSEMNWVVIMLFYIPMLLMFWNKPSRLNQLKKKMKKNMSEQLEIALKTKWDGTKLMLLIIFFFLMFLNLVGLIPNLFTCTSHLTFNLSLSIPFWISYMLYGWTMHTNNMLSHLVPMGTPMPLISFMVVIEMISNFIRPFTLSIRLMANMISGHLLLSLLGDKMSLMNFINIFLISMIQNMLMILELGVAMIQSYVFCILLTLYSDDSDF
uniref:ATP synthase subunit 6 n=1 Tax=Bregmatothrips sinensis TaxID=3045418 RepID=UPI0030DDF187